VTDAAWCAGQKLEQLCLIAEEHLQIRPAISQHQRIVELAHGFADSLRADEGPVVDSRVLTRRASHYDQLGSRTFRELDEGVVPRVAHHRDVVPRAEALDQPQLLEQRRELARRVFPLDLFG